MTNKEVGRVILGDTEYRAKIFDSKNLFGRIRWACRIDKKPIHAISWTHKDTISKIKNEEQAVLTAKKELERLENLNN
jgi:hypothetical protein